MKWKNVDAGPGYYYITGTITEWLPLLARPAIREKVYQDIRAALKACDGLLAAYVVMPTHIHLLVRLPEADLLHKFCKLWRGRSGRHIPQILERQGDLAALEILSAHANGGCRYAAWKEQARALLMWSKDQISTKIDYIHANPVRRGLVPHPADWPHSSYSFYERGLETDMDIVPVDY